MTVEYLFVQCQPSQVDGPFYQALHEMMPARVLVILYNECANERRDIDPELGFAPTFPRLDTGYATLWVSPARRGLTTLARRIREIRPRYVVLQDQSWGERLVLAAFCRAFGIRVAIRSDKNAFSAGVRKGWRLRLEQCVVKLGFDMLCPVSELTTQYYGWKRTSMVEPFPYCTDERKFHPSESAASARSAIRSKHGIPDDAIVFLTVAKFVPRENPRAAIEAFRSVVAEHPGAWLLMVGAGPSMATDQKYVADNRIPNVRFAGYVPYADLEAYFFSADVFVHLANIEPWGVSPQDALFAGLGLVATDVVGSAVTHLGRGLARFLVPVGDVPAAADRMRELLDRGHIARVFAPARERVRSAFATRSVAGQWAKRAAATAPMETSIHGS